MIAAITDSTNVGGNQQVSLELEEPIEVLPGSGNLYYEICLESDGTQCTLYGVNHGYLTDDETALDVTSYDKPLILNEQTCTRLLSSITRTKVKVVSE